MLSRELVHELNNDVAKILGLCRMIEIALKNLNVDENIKGPLTEKAKLSQTLLLGLSERVRQATSDVSQKS